MARLPDQRTPDELDVRGGEAPPLGGQVAPGLPFVAEAGDDAGGAGHGEDVVERDGGEVLGGAAEPLLELREARFELGDGLPTERLAAAAVVAGLKGRRA